MVFQLSHGLQRRAFAARGIEIEAECFCELKLRDLVIILGGDENRILVGERDLRLQNVESRHRARIKAVLLILQLALQKFDRLLLHTDERAIEQNLVELLFRRRDYLVNGVAKRVVARVAGKISGTNLRNDPAAGKDNLRRLKADIVRALDAAEVKARTSDWRGGRTRTRRGCRKTRTTMVYLEVRIGVGKLTGHL